MAGFHQPAVRNVFVPLVNFMVLLVHACKSLLHVSIDHSVGNMNALTEFHGPLKEDSW